MHKQSERRCGDAHDSYFVTPPPARVVVSSYNPEVNYCCGLDNGGSRQKVIHMFLRRCKPIVPLWNSRC